MTAGRCRKPIFAAMKFTAQMTTMTTIEEFTIGRPGGRPCEVATSTESGQPFFANRELLDPLQTRLVADARIARHANGSLRRYGHFGLDNVLIPVAAARGDVAGQ